MSNSLIHRFNGWPTAFTVENEILSRERRMEKLAEHQVAAQSYASNQIAKSQIKGANIVASEIKNQTAILEAAVVGIGNQISDVIQASADQISYMLDQVGDRICASLDEIKWELVQQNVISSQIFKVLHESRSNEARQLVNQGIRHYLNSQYDKAEERFKEALKFDTTDYQVLMNLGYIEIQKDNAAAAYDYFRDALNLPANLDSNTKADTIWAMARLRYAEKKFNEALTLSLEAIKLKDPIESRKLFTIGVYSALSGKDNEAIKYIRKAIAMDSSCFSIAASDPDLNGISGKILELLADISLNAKSKAEKLINELEINLKNYEAYKKSKEYLNIVEKLKNKFNEVKTIFNDLGYSRYIKTIQIMESVCQTYPMFYELKGLYDDQLKIKNDLKIKNEEKKAVGKSKNTESPIAAMIGIPLIIYLMTAVYAYIQEVAQCFSSSSLADKIIGGPLTIILGPFFAILWPFIYLDNEPRLKYSIIAIIISGVGNLIWGLIRSKHNNNIEMIEAKHSEVMSKLNQVNNQINENKSAILQHL